MTTPRATPRSSLTSTPTAVATATRTRAAAEVVPVRTMGTQAPLLLFGHHDVLQGGSPAFAAHIDADIPIYALLRWDEPEPQTIEGIAAHVVSALRGLQPVGPYRLLGWSWGAGVAYEVATQLIGQDQTVAFLGLLDTGASDPPAHPRALDGYAMHPLPIAVHLFAAAEGGPTLDSQRLARPFLRGCEVLPAKQIRTVTLPGRREAMLEPSHALELGRALSQAIAACGEPQPLLEALYHPEITIQMGERSRAPLFCLPGAGDSVVAFTGLADALGEACPIQGLQTRGLDGSLVPHSTVEAAAAMHVRAIQRVQPQGAVNLLGHSFGGWLALEVAHQLRARDRSVASLTILDARAPDSDSAHGREYTACQALMELVEVLELAAGSSLDIDPNRCEALDGGARLQLLHEGCVRVGLMPRSSRPETLLGVLRTFSTALRTPYRPRHPYVEPMRLVLATDPRCDGAANRRQHQHTVTGWERWAPSLTHHHAPGNHVAISRAPHVRAWAHLLRSSVELETSERAES